VEAVSFVLNVFKFVAHAGIGKGMAAALVVNGAKVSLSSQLKLKTTSGTPRELGASSPQIIYLFCVPGLSP